MSAPRRHTVQAKPIEFWIENRRRDCHHFWLSQHCTPQCSTPWGSCRFAIVAVSAPRSCDYRLSKGFISNPLQIGNDIHQNCTITSSTGGGGQPRSQQRIRTPGLIEVQRHKGGSIYLSDELCMNDSFTSQGRVHDLQAAKLLYLEDIIVLGGEVAIH